MTIIIFIIFILEISALFGALSWIAFFYALKIGKASNVSIIDRSSFLFVVLFSIIILNEELTIKKVIASILMFIALVLFVIRIINHIIY